jgi:hypothetical protein
MGLIFGRLIIMILPSLVIAAITTEHREVKKLGMIDAIILCVCSSTVLGFFLIRNSQKAGSKLSDTVFKEKVSEGTAFLELYI